MDAPKIASNSMLTLGMRSAIIAWREAPMGALAPGPDQ